MKYKTGIFDLIKIFLSNSVPPNPFMWNTAYAFRYMGLNLSFWPLLDIFGKKFPKGTFLNFSKLLTFLVEQIVTDDVDIEKYAINRSDLK